MSDIGEFAYHGTNLPNYKEAFLDGIYDRSRIQNAAQKFELHLADTKEMAYGFALMTAKEIDVREIIILWGHKIGPSEMRVDMLFKPVRTEHGVKFENITHNMNSIDEAFADN